MMTPWDLFDLESANDTRSIKRRYAQLLKQYRPDDDPVAFQNLRDAYEYALEWVARDQDEVTPVQGLKQAADTAIADYPPLFFASEQTEPQCSTEEMQVRALPDTCTSLDEALVQAREAQMEGGLQLELLRRCQQPGERALEILHWAIKHLNWLTPWQANYLPLTAMAELSQRLFDHELAQLWEILPTASEAMFIERIQGLACQKWLQPLELNAQLQQALVPLLESYRNGSTDLLEQLSELFGWNESDAYLPCDAEHWARLGKHLAYTGTWRALQEQLSLPKPQQSKEKACWFLLKPMKDGARRQMSDRFGAADWAACDYLAREIEERQPHIPERMSVSYFTAWRQWKPQEWGGWAVLYAFLIMLLVLNADQLYRKQSADEPVVILDLLLASVASMLMILVLYYLQRGWSGLARAAVNQDVWISRFLIPPNVFRQGSGLLLMRHVLLALFFAVLVSSWVRHLSSALAVLLGTVIFVGSVYFLVRVTRGASPHAWLTPVARVFLVINWKMLLLWLAILVGGVLLARLIGPEVTQSRSLRSDPFNVCARPATVQQQRDCEQAAQIIREALKRPD